MSDAARHEPHGFVYLASQSPRRRQLLDQIGVRHELLLADAAEDAEALEAERAGESPRVYVERVTRAKLHAARQRFADRHRDLDLMLRQNAARADDVLGDAADERRCLVGAYLTQEYAFSAAAVTNPSMVPAPDQTDVAPGALRFVLSMRVIGEGHISSVAFRTGEVSPEGAVTLDEGATLAETENAWRAATGVSRKSTPAQFWSVELVDGL